MARLAKEDWEILDGLLGKLGFGGYYDCLEVVKNIGVNIAPKEFHETIKKEGDLHDLIVLVYRLSRKGEK